jgi:hypothetical protein
MARVVKFFFNLIFTNKVVESSSYSYSVVLRVKDDKQDQDSSSTSSDRQAFSPMQDLQQLLAVYRTASLAFNKELDQFAKDMEQGKDLAETSFADLANKSVALNAAEATLSLYMATQVQNEKLRKQELELQKTRNEIITLRKENEKRKEKLREKVKALGEPDLAAKFFLPGNWLEMHKESKVHEVSALSKEVAKVDKVIESKLSGLSPEDRKKVELESKKALKEPVKVATEKPKELKASPQQSPQVAKPKQVTQQQVPAPSAPVKKTPGDLASRLTQASVVTTAAKSSVAPIDTPGLEEIKANNRTKADKEVMERRKKDQSQ